jgi:hypothetical protein
MTDQIRFRGIQIDPISGIKHDLYNCEKCGSTISYDRIRMHRCNAVIVSRFDSDGSDYNIFYDSYILRMKEFNDLFCLGDN